MCYIQTNKYDDHLKARVLFFLVNGFVRGKDCLVMKCDWFIVYNVKIM